MLPSQILHCCPWTFPCLIPIILIVLYAHKRELDRKLNFNFRYGFKELVIGCTRFWVTVSKNKFDRDLTRIFTEWPDRQIHNRTLHNFLSSLPQLNIQYNWQSQFTLTIDDPHEDSHFYCLILPLTLITLIYKLQLINIQDQGKESKDSSFHCPFLSSENL